MIKPLKVKNLDNIGIMIIAFAITPIIGLGLAFSISDSTIIGGVICGLIYLAIMTWFIYKTIKKKDVFDIVADELGITLKKCGFFKWDEINEFYIKREHAPFRNNSSNFLVIRFKNKRVIKIEADSCDIPGKEIEIELRKLQQHNFNISS